MVKLPKEPSCCVPCAAVLVPVVLLLQVFDKWPDDSDSLAAAGALPLQQVRLVERGAAATRNDVGAHTLLRVQPELLPGRVCRRFCAATAAAGAGGPPVYESRLSQQPRSELSIG